MIVFFTPQFLSFKLHFCDSSLEHIRINIFLFCWLLWRSYLGTRLSLHKPQEQSALMEKGGPSIAFIQVQLTLAVGDFLSNLALE
jgi:hypothetical protein